LFCPQSIQIGNAHTEWQWPLSGVHSIMMVKPDRPGKGGGERPSPFTRQHLTPRAELWCTLHAADRADTLYLFLLYPYMHSRSGCAVLLNPLSCTQRVKGGKANYFFSFAKSQIFLGITTQFKISNFFFLSVPVR
jgi:hypothetical protein